jgi:malonyl CoA-acyl carrier protein transacylase
MSIAFIFPGQGSQAVGMGKALADNFPSARKVFDEVDAALNEKLTATIWEGPVDRLTLTENAQPALMAVSLATLRVLESEAGFDLKRDAAFVAGHSLGEYSALAAAGALSIADTARLLRTRGRAMQAAVPVGEGAMAALLGLDFATAAEVSVHPPVVPVVANVLARAISDPAEIVRALVAQVTGTVRWRECISYMAEHGVDSFYEVGAGKVLSGLVKRIAPGASGTAIGTPDDVAAFKAARPK